jgi:hypothetical protein
VKAPARRLAGGAALVLALTGPGPAFARGSPDPVAPGTPQPGPGASAASAGCQLVLVEHRSARPLLRAPLPTRDLRVAFVHSVLGTPVEDRYRWHDGHWRLIEERFEGAGYGLPHAAAAGERLLREGEATRLLLNRRVSPLVIRALPAQRMRVALDDGREWLLGELSTQAIELTADDC